MYLCVKGLYIIEFKLVLESTVGTRYNTLLYYADFDIRWLLHGSMTGTYYFMARATITEGATFEASQENWDTFTDFVCLTGICFYYFKTYQVFARCVNEKVVGY